MIPRSSISTSNPEFYLYGCHHPVDPTQEVWITKDMFNCLRIIQSGKQSVCNFGLPYLSVRQYQLLPNCDRVVLEWSGGKRDIAYTDIASLKTFYRFAYVKRGFLNGRSLVFLFLF